MTRGGGGLKWMVVDRSFSSSGASRHSDRADEGRLLFPVADKTGCQLLTATQRLTTHRPFSLKFERGFTKEK